MLGIARGFVHFCGMPYFPLYDNASFYCLECGTPLGYGRHDRKFCSAACKNRWHNARRYPGLDKTVARVLRILESNREVLSKLVRMGIHDIDRLTLQHLGFRAEYSTSFRLVSRRHQVYTCFDYTYELTPSRVRHISWISPEEEAQREGAGKKKK